MGTFLQRTCLKSTNSLRTQLLLGFGTITFATLLVVVIVACTSTYIAGWTVKDQADKLMRGQVTDNLLIGSRLVGEHFDAYMADLEGTVQLLTEAVKDRIVGYPYDGWEDDLFVPFYDIESRRNVYPLNHPPCQMDWNTTLNINAENAEEHLQERAHWSKIFPDVATASALYFMQGVCDPSEKNASVSTYYPNCTEANNDFRTGGVVQPTPTSRGLYEKSGDITVFLKSLYESQYDALAIGVYFHNSGAGSVVKFPSFHWNMDNAPPYVSIGCDWMRSTNPRTGAPFATENDIARCHPNGTLVLSREYNPMERPWCRDFALNPDAIVWYGPFLSLDSGIAQMMVGRSVFDRRSGELIACVAIDISVSDLNKQLNSSVLNEDSGLFLARFDDGSLVSSSLDTAHLKERTPLHIADTGLINMETFKAFQELVDFGKQWEPEEAENKFLSASVNIDNKRKVMTAYPIPLIPEEYDPSYQPKFLVMHSIDSGVYEVVDSISRSIDNDVLRICILTVGLSLVGMMLVLFILWMVSQRLTQPLLWMENVAWKIVNHADEQSGDTLKMIQEEGMYASPSCTPKTEVNQLVAEFRTMIKGFSGSGASKVAEQELYEVHNDFTWHSEFQQLYYCHKKNHQRTFQSATVSSVITSAEEESTSSDKRHGILQRPLNDRKKKELEEAVSLVVPAPVKRNHGLICTPAKDRLENTPQQILIHHSPLFWWIVILIVLPLLLLIGLTCGIVSNDIVTTIPSWVKQADTASDEVALDALNLTASSKALMVTAVVFESIRDLNLMTRLAGWLFFGGVKRSAAFTEMDTSAENCKIHPKGSCPSYKTNAPCPCEWRDMNGEGACTSHNKTESRNLQKQFWSVLSQDADPETGQRTNSSSFPPVGSSPSSTEWFADFSLLPGFEKGEAAAGYATTYDRVRVSSAMATTLFPIYNYATSLGRKHHILSVLMAFEADGLSTGFTGCRHAHQLTPFWKSSKENQAATIAPALCPLGKYGLDGRCRDWYATGKQAYNSSNIPVHVTAPYQFAASRIVATSATAAVANPKTNEYIGQTLLDFFPEGIKRGLEWVDGVTSILITPDVDATGGDTVVGPNGSAGWKSASILDLLFEYDGPGSPYRLQFEQDSLAAMKSGVSDMRNFWRTNEQGVPEYLKISFAPVYERVLLPVSPDDFARGVNSSQVLMYSVGMIRSVEDIHAPFSEIEAGIQMQLSSLHTAYVTVTAVAAVLFVVLTCIITVYIVGPMITLLRAVQSVNQRLVYDDLPPLQGGSREVHGVYNTFSKLYKVVRISNTAFFSGNLKWAYHFTSDALQLFRKANDQKAVAIACNNLGNTLFAVYYDVVDIGLDETGEKSLIPLALKHYGEAIELGEQEFERTPDSELKAEFALQLADRLFNRGLFLLLIQGHEMAPADARQQAFADIHHCRSLDYDVKDYMMEHRLLLKHSSSYFSRLLRRINGLADFYDDVGLHEVWDVKELVDDADRLLFAAWNEPSAPLFEAVNRAGRLQQLEAAAILLWHSMGNHFEAARLAMRMFSEDEFILESSFARAADALLKFLRGENESVSFSKKTMSCAQEDIRRMSRSCKNVSFDIGKCLVFALELCEIWEGEPILEKINTNCLALYDRLCLANDYMGVVAFSTKESLSVELGTKELNEGRQRTLLDIASTSTTKQPTPAFPLAIQMVIDSHASLDNDSYVVVVLDGKAWDREACSSFHLQLERLNRERNTSIHLLIIGLSIDDISVRDECIKLCNVSKLSMYADATLDTVDLIFESFATAIGGRPMNNQFLKGITMERF